MDSIIKKIKQGLTIAASSALIFGTLTAGAIGFVNYEYRDYRTDDETYSMAESIGCDAGYIRKVYNHYAKLAHNNNEPIYVCLDDALSEQEKKDSVRALDYMFGIVGTINSNYKYKLVDKAEYDKMLNKSKIYFTIPKKSGNLPAEQNSALAYVSSKVSVTSMVTTKRTLNNNIVYLVRENLERSTNDDEIFESCVHELGHVFGLDDVYTVGTSKSTDKFYGNTFMNNNYAAKIGRLTPNDVKCLISLYSEQKTISSDVKQFLKQYTKEFYDHYTNLVVEKAKINENFELENFTFKSNLKTVSLEGVEYGYTYDIVVEDGKYTFTILDVYTGKKLDSCVGKVVNVNGVVVLKDLSLKSGLRPYDEQDSYKGGFVQDLVVVSRDDKTILYDLISNMDMYGKAQELEKGMEL